MYRIRDFNGFSYALDGETYSSFPRQIVYCAN